MQIEQKFLNAFLAGGLEAMKEALYAVQLETVHYRHTCQNYTLFIRVLHDLGHGSFDSKGTLCILDDWCKMIQDNYFTEVIS